MYVYYPVSRIQHLASINLKMGGKLRVGLGFDAHAFDSEKSLMLGGIKVDYPQGLAGHSDADVILHAIIDALLGASSLGNIGTLFPETKEFEGASSLMLLKKTIEILSENGFFVINIDVTVILEEPYLNDYLNQMVQAIAEVLSIGKSAICIKAKTTEGMGFTGKKEGIASFAVALVNKK